jgi:hypothetical protein
MNEPTIIPLHTIFEDPVLVTDLASVMKRRALEESFTRGERPSGARLSIDDPVRRVKAIFDPWWRTPVKDEIGRRGYLCEDLLEVGVIMAETGIYAHVDEYDEQVTIPWGPAGEGWQSAFDFVLAGGRVVSCKSSTTAPIEKLKPSSANVAQERRMLALAGRAAGTKFDVWMVHPGSLAARGPFTYVLEQEHIDAALAEADGVERAWDHFKRAPKNNRGDRAPWDLPEWNDPDYWERTYGLVSTSGAFRFERLDACGAIEDRNRRFVRLRDERLEAAKAEDAAKELLFPYVREQIELKRQTDPLAKSVTAYSGDSLVTYTLRKDGAIVTTVKPLDRPAAADAAA